MVIKAQETDRPTAALITDLKQRGMLDDTLVVWGGEFGRTPMSPGLHLLGIDHKRLTVKFLGLDARLTGIAGSMVNGILA